MNRKKAKHAIPKGLKEVRRIVPLGKPPRKLKLRRRKGRNLVDLFKGMQLRIINKFKNEASPFTPKINRKREFFNYVYFKGTPAGINVLGYAREKLEEKKIEASKKEQKAKKEFESFLGSKKPSKKDRIKAYWEYAKILELDHIRTLIELERVELWKALINNNFNEAAARLKAIENFKDKYPEFENQTLKDY